jgi:hypothetical protein
MCNRLALVASAVRCGEISLRREEEEKETRITSVPACRNDFMVWGLKSLPRKYIKL